MEQYAEVKKPRPVPAPRHSKPKVENSLSMNRKDTKVPPAPESRKRTLVPPVPEKREASQPPPNPENREDSQAPPIPEKSQALLQDIDLIHVHDQCTTFDGTFPSSGENEHTEVDVKPKQLITQKKTKTKKTKKKPNKLPQNIEIVQAPHDIHNVADFPVSPTSQSNPFYDGIIFLDSSATKPQSPVNTCHKVDTGAQPIQIHEATSKKTSRLEIVSEAEAGFSAYELAQPVDSNCNHDESHWKHHSRKPLPPLPLRPASRDTSNLHPAKRSTTTKQQAATHAADISLDTIIVDKFFFNYIGMFRTDEINSISTNCKIQSKEIKGKNCREIELWFTGGTSVVATEAQERFIQLYQSVKQQLWVESIDVSNVINTNDLQDELENKYKCLCYNNGGCLEIVCQKTDLSIIRRCVMKHSCSKPDTQDQWIPSDVDMLGRPGSGAACSLPVGYDVGSAYTVYIYKMDITKLKVTAIVNAANSQLTNKEGIAKTISEAAGPDVDKDCSEKTTQHRKEIPVGDVIYTRPGQLPCKHVLHAVTPHWTNVPKDQEDCINQLLKTFENVLDAVIQDDSIKSVAVPPLGSGHIFGVPPEKVATAIYCALITKADPATRPTKMNNKDIHIVDIADNVLQFLVSLFGHGGRVKPPSGKSLALTKLPDEKLQKFGNYQASTHEYKKLIDNRNVSERRKKGAMAAFAGIFGCGSKRMKKDQHR